MPNKKFFTLAEEKFKKSYLKEKKNKKVLFVYDKQNKPGKKDYGDLENCLELDFSAIRNDRDMKANKAVIQNQLKELQKKMKEFQDVVIPDSAPLGIKLAKKAPNQYSLLLLRPLKSKPLVQNRLYASIIDLMCNF